VGRALASIAVKLLLPKLMVWIGTWLPFLAAGPIGWVVRFVVGLIAEKLLVLLFTEGEHQVKILGIKLEVRREHREYAFAYQKYLDSISLPDVTRKEKKNAEKVLDLAFDQYVIIDL